MSTQARLLELAVRKGELKARCAQQRDTLAAAVWPVEKGLAVADSALLGVDWLKRHPVAVGIAVAAAVLFRPRRSWRWARRGFVLWSSWRALRSRLFGSA